MLPKLQPVRGTHDILPENCGGEFERFHAVVTRARELATLYGFHEMATPIFEPTEVFARSLGDTSDIVHKEMFTFQTKGDESVTLRPEFTAAVVRAFLSNGMQQYLPLKLFSTGPLFRYERPQKGRQRQFHQVNFEWLGDASPEADVELIILAGHLLWYLTGVKDCTLLINTLGDAESRARYREALVQYLTPYAKELSEDSQRRLTTNPLRILDSKSEQDQKILEAAPNITEYLSPASNQRFDTICKSLQHKEMPFFLGVKIERSLVRGLDYYTDTVFEIISATGELGAQNTVLAGGRYDGLVEQMGGKPTPAIGFAAGIERLLLLKQYPQRWEKPKDIKIIVLPLEEMPKEKVHSIVAPLRDNLYLLLLNRHTKQQCSLEIEWQGNLKKRMERADKHGATHVVILSPEGISVKNMGTREQREVTRVDLSEHQKLIDLFNIAELDSRLRGNGEV